MTRTVLIGIAGAVIVVVALFLNDWLNRTPSQVDAGQTAEQGETDTRDSGDTEQGDPAAGESNGDDMASRAAETAEEVVDQLNGTDDDDQAASAEPSDDAASTDGTDEAAKPGEEAPTFDVVRISREGDTVIAGRAPPGSEVTIYDGDQPIGTVTADDRGEWVYLPTEPLAPGSHELSLSAKLPGEDGGTVESDSKVVLVVPERGKDIAGRPSAKPQKPLAMLVPKDEGEVGAKVLQKPSVPGSVESDTGDLALDSVDYDEEGNISLSGRAVPGTEVRAYLDNDLIGRAEVPPTGLWRMSPDGSVAPGPYTLRLDMVEGQGDVAARVELPFSRAEPAKDFEGAAFVVVQPGNSLWRIARRTLDSGFNYTVIYEANKDQIRDPDLIYPGQIFEVPAN